MRKEISNRIKNIIYFIVMLILYDPFSLKYLHLWIKSSLPNYSPKTDQIPWITFKSKTWLDKFLKIDMKVFEYGSGGSTLFFSKRVKMLISIEHDEKWYIEILKDLTKEKLNNVEYQLLKAEKRDSSLDISYSEESYTSTDIMYKGMTFERYVRSIEAFPDEFFDLIFIDGRARLSCIPLAIKKIRLGGVILLDNSERQEYSRSSEILSQFKRVDFYGSGPHNMYLWQTSIWQKIKK